MVFGSIGFLEQQPNFLNLSLLICHLFAGGNFRVINIMHHPGTLDNRLLFSIDSVCAFQIPKTMQDISANETIPIDRQNQRTDGILQLIFLPPDQLIEQFNRVEKLFTFYHVFIFTTSAQLHLDQIKPIATGISSSSSLLLIYNSFSDALSEFTLSKNLIQSVELNKGQLNSQEIFDSVFGDRASGRFLVVSTFIDITCNSFRNTDIIVRALKVFGSLYFKQLNSTFVDGIVWNCNNKSVQNQRVRPVKRSFYSDYFFRYELDPESQK